MAYRYQKEWYVEDKRHRLDGPAVECADGTKEWYVEDKLHRMDGPSVEKADGKEWYVEGKRHRSDGPAIEYADGGKQLVQQRSLIQKAVSRWNCNQPQHNYVITYIKFDDILFL